MSIEKIPQFTPEAARLWSEISAEDRKFFLSHTLCTSCGGVVRIKNFNGRVDSGDLVLVGQCSNCEAAVARVIEVG
jgi:hypothetical protein